MDFYTRMFTFTFHSKPTAGWCSYNHANHNILRTNNTGIFFQQQCNVSYWCRDIIKRLENDPCTSQIQPSKLLTLELSNTAQFTSCCFRKFTTRMALMPGDTS